MSKPGTLDQDSLLSKISFIHKMKKEVLITLSLFMRETKSHGRSW